MYRSVWSARSVSSIQCRRRGYTLIEVLTATALTLVMISAVARIFGQISSSVADSRSTLEMSDRLRSAAARLQLDLAGHTVTPIPPRTPETNEGYTEISEGPVGPVIAVIPKDYAAYYPKDIPVDPTDAWAPRAFKPHPDDETIWYADTTVGDNDDILMLTTRSADRPFVGRRWNAVTSQVEAIESHVAEVAWFIRGRTLYRRVLLVAPGVNVSDPRLFPPAGFYELNDLSVHAKLDASNNLYLVANTLADLTRPENRFAHPQDLGFPFDVRRWGELGLPTLRECSHGNWVAGATNPGQLPITPKPGSSVNGVIKIDFWNDPHPWEELEPMTGTHFDFFPGPRVAEDVILTNVIGFDIKVWDPGAPIVQDNNDNTIVLAPGDPDYPPPNKIFVDFTPVSYGAYVDLGYLNDGYGISNPRYVPLSGMPVPNFHHTGTPLSKLQAGFGPSPGLVARVYDTWSLHYEYDGVDQDNDGMVDEGTDGFDNDQVGVQGVVDDPGERETSPPYPVPLRGIQIKIRVFEPDTRNIREVTIIQDFLPK